MTTTLDQQVQRVARQAVRLVRWYGVGRFLSVVGTTLLVMGMLDYLLRYQDPGVRWIATGTVWVVLAAGFYRFLVGGWRYRCTTLQAARRIERRFPALGDYLSSGVAFATQAAEDPWAGSPVLRRAVISQAQAAIGTVDVGRCLDRRPVRWALAWAVLLWSCAALVAVLDTGATRLALTRMFVPWAAEPWPRRHVLRIVSPVTRIAAGQDYEVVVVDTNGRLPQRIQIHWWTVGNEQAQIQTVDVPSGESLLTWRRANVTAGFRIRVSGGDDDEMAWQAVDVVAPPRIVDQQLTLHPPAYTGAATRQASGSLQVLDGTRIIARARVDRRLARAVLETNTMDQPRSLALVRDADGYGFRSSLAASPAWVVRRSGTYGFRLVDAEGLDAGVAETWEVRVTEDAPPLATLVRPTTDASVLATAVLPVEAVVQDDLAVRSIRLEFTRSSLPDSGPTQVVLFAGPDQPGPVEQGSDGPEAGNGMRTVVRHAWDLSGLAGLQAGESITLQVVATDYKDQVGRSSRRRLAIITRDEFLERLGRLQTQVLGRIAETLHLQQQVRAQVRLLEIQVQETQNLQRDDVDQLQSAELNQRQVRQQLSRPGDGVQAALQDILDQMAINRVDNPETVGRLQTLRDIVARLDEMELARIPHHLVTALKAARRQLTSPEAAARATLLESLPAAGMEQDNVVKALEQLLGDFAQWDDYQRLTRELAHVRRQQADVAQRTVDLRTATLTRAVRDLTPQQRSDVRGLAERQSELARQFARWLSRLEQTGRQLTDRDPAAADTLAEVAHLARTQGTGAVLHDAARQAQQNQLGRAVEQQQQALQQLGQLLDLLANRPAQAVDRLLDQLTQAAAQLDRLQDRQQQVAQTAAASQLDPKSLRQLAGAERQLAEESQQLARAVERLRAPAAATALHQAAESLDRAATAGQQGQPDTLRQQAGAATRQLDQAAQQLQDALRGAEQRADRQQREQVRAILDTLATDQVALRAETGQLDEVRVAAAPSPDQAAAIDTLATRQQQLADQTSRLAALVPDWAVFLLSLEQVADLMGQAHDRLARQETNQPTRQLQARAGQWLRQLQDVLDPDAPPVTPGEEPERPPGEADNEPGETPADGALLAQLKLLRIMQLEVLRETGELESARAENGWNAQLTRRQEILVRRQSRLADVLAQLLNTPAKTPVRPPAAPPQDPFEGLDSLLDRGQLPSGTNPEP